MDQFDIPVALVFFNRPLAVGKVLEAVRAVRPRRLYLVSDGARVDRDDEDALVELSRRTVTDAIDWPCEVATNFAESNRGCYDRIAGGASWVFAHEKWAIFLEDDNVPQHGFFRFCSEALRRYEETQRVLYVAGANYLIESEPANGSDVLFSRGMFPCGWASWSDRWQLYRRFPALWEDQATRERVLRGIRHKTYRRYKKSAWMRVYEETIQGKRPYTWDHQWHYVLYALDKVCIVPRYNQINNIGVGPEATHGGTKMTTHLSRLLSLKTIPMRFPLRFANEIEVDEQFDDSITELICSAPLTDRIMGRLRRMLGERR